MSAAQSNSLRNSLLLLGVLTVLSCALQSAQAGEKPRIYSSGAWQDGQKSAAASKLVVVAKVIEAGKARGKGWDGNVKREGVHTNWTGEVSIDQHATIEITAVLRGSFGGKKLRITLDKARLKYRELLDHWRRNHHKLGKAAAATQVPAGDFALHEGRAYLLFLDVPKSGGKGKDGEELPASATHLEDSAPAETSNAALLKSVRAFCKLLRAWEHPPKLSVGEAEKVDKLIAQLGDEQYGKRQEADGALRKIADRLQPQLTRAAKRPDLPRATAELQILNDCRPTPGKAMKP